MNDQSVRPSPAATAPAPRSIFASDTPSAEHADQTSALFAELLVHARAETPLALAVVGAAGAGKSSFLESALARARALALAARSTPASPILTRVVAATADFSRLSEEARPVEIAAALTGALRRALRKAGGGWANAAEEADAASADPQAQARAEAAAYDAARKRCETEARELETLRGLRARLSDALLFDTPGSKVDSYARGARSRIEADLRRFGFVEQDSTIAYKQLVSEVAELGGGAKAAPSLMRAIWGFASQRKLLIWAGVFAALWLGLGAAWEARASWEPLLREQGAGALADALVTRGWMGTLREGALWLALASLALNLWRAWRFVRPLTRGAALLKAEHKERGAALDTQIAALSRRVEGLRAETEAARKSAEAAAARYAQIQQAPRADLDATAPDERFLEALPHALSAQGEAGRLVVGLDGFDHLPPEAAARALSTARRLLAAPGVAILAAVDVERLAPALGRESAERRAWVERQFQAVWRLEPDASGDLLVALVAPRSGAEPPAADASRSALDEPLTLLEADLLKRVAPIAGGRPRASKRLLNLYRLARPVVGERPAFALALAAEIGGWADPAAANAAVAEGREADQFDPRVLSAVRAARAASPSGALSAADLAAARSLARRFVAPGA